VPPASAAAIVDEAGAGCGSHVCPTGSRPRASGGGNGETWRGTGRRGGCSGSWGLWAAPVGFGASAWLYGYFIKLYIILMTFNFFNIKFNYLYYL